MIGHMRDRGSLIQLLDAFGIEQSDAAYPYGGNFVVQKNDDGTTSVILGPGIGNGTVDFCFDENGFFVDWGVFHE